jgi:7-cyano-7-deazaguanine synthase
MEKSLLEARSEDLEILGKGERMTSAALVVLSGGQDSTTCLFWAKERFDKVRALTFDYGQRHRIEINAASTIATLAGVPHEVVNCQGMLLSSSPLTSDTPLEEYRDYESMDKIIGDRVELTFVPMRNVFFLTLAMNRAVHHGCKNLVTGICQADNANYPDCTESFRASFEAMANQALGVTDFQVWAPLMNLSKAQTCQLAFSMKDCWEALAWTHTSYDGIYPPSGHNHANVLRAHGFEEAGLPDPLVLRAYHDGLMALPKTKNYEAFREKV